MTPVRFALPLEMVYLAGGQRAWSRVKVEKRVKPFALTFAREVASKLIVQEIEINQRVKLILSRHGLPGSMFEAGLPQMPIDFPTIPAGGEVAVEVVNASGYALQIQPVLFVTAEEA